VAVAVSVSIFAVGQSFFSSCAWCLLYSVAAWFIEFSLFRCEWHYWRVRVSPSILPYPKFDTVLIPAKNVNEFVVATDWARVQWTKTVCVSGGRLVIMNAAYYGIRFDEIE
jgi:hypothetical protein